jgi:hypothetical protein
VLARLLVLLLEQEQLVLWALRQVVLVLVVQHLMLVRLRHPSVDQ